MMNLQTTLPNTGFPHEFDTIAFLMEDTREACLFQIKCYKAGSDSIETEFDMVLSPDVNGKIRIEDFAPVLRDFTSDGLARDITILWQQQSIQFKVLPCRVDMASDASDFCAAHFLSLCGGNKTTYLGSPEYLYFYTMTDEAHGLSLLWVNAQTGETRETSLSDFPDGTENISSGYYRLDVSPAQFSPPADGFSLHSYTVAVGKRSRRFVLCPVLDEEPLTFVFRNCFGQMDSFHCFGTIQQEVKPTRSTASFAGKTRNYSVQAVPEYTVQTSYLRSTEFYLFEDLCASTYVLLHDEAGPEVCITDNDFKLSNDLYVPQQASISWRPVGRTKLFEPAAPRTRTFDHTFDDTYL